MKVQTVADFGGIAREARSRRGWTQQQAADAAGVARTFVVALEGGQHTAGELWRVLAVLAALEVTLDATVENRDTVATETSSNSETAFDLDTHLASFRIDPEQS